MRMGGGQQWSIALSSVVFVQVQCIQTSTLLVPMVPPFSSVMISTWCGQDRTTHVLFPEDVSPLQLSSLEGLAHQVMHSAPGLLAVIIEEHP